MAKHLSLLVTLSVALLSGLAFSASPAFAQTTNLQRSYINPFPKNDRYRIVVLGDSLGDGLWSGLYRSFQGDKDVEVVRHSKISTGLVRSDYYNWNAKLKTILKQDGPFQIAVVMFGANDDQPIHEGGHWYKLGTPGWQHAYGQRVAEFLKTLRDHNIATYWVGLPVMRSPQMNTDAETMNDIFREKSFIYQTKFIDTWTGFTDQSGHYTAYGPDMGGQMRRLRANDGVHFTMRGYLKLAHFVVKQIRHDLTLAKLDRNIPLAGAPAEQAKVTDHQYGSSAQNGVDSSGHAISVDKDGNGSKQSANIGKPKLEQSVVGGVELIRPVISKSALAATQVLAPQGAASVPIGETVASDLGNGLTALSSISAVSDTSVVSSKPRLPLAERPYYRVLVRGDQLKPKPGRADDYSWPTH